MISASADKTQKMRGGQCLRENNKKFFIHGETTARLKIDRAVFL
jgi:hypothetical protein